MCDVSNMLGLLHVLFSVYRSKCFFKNHFLVFALFYGSICIKKLFITHFSESNRSIDNAKLEKKVFQPKQSNGDKSKQGQSKTRTLDRSQGHVKVTQQHQISSVPQRQKEPVSSAAGE